MSHNVATPEQVARNLLTLRDKAYNEMLAATNTPEFELKSRAWRIAQGAVRLFRAQHPSAFVNIEEE